MPYTVWSNDRLVGESDLDYVASNSQHKIGDFAATEFGEQIIPVLMAPRKATCAHASLEEIELLYDRRETIPLQLRAPDGRVIPTDHIEITDLEWLMSLATPLDSVPDDWQADLELADIELADALAPDEAFRDQLAELLPPEWLQQQSDPLRFDEFDIPDIEFGQVEEPEGPPPEYPRYQIQVQIRNGG